MYRPDAEPSVHLTLFPDSFEGFRDDALAAKWEIIRNVRRVVTGALEVERAAKNIGSSLEASPLVYVSRQDDLRHAVRYRSGRGIHHLERDGDQWGCAGRAHSASTTCPASPWWSRRRVGTKCARSWKILPTVGEDAEYPDVSPRDAAGAA